MVCSDFGSGIVGYEWNWFGLDEFSVVRGEFSFQINEGDSGRESISDGVDIRRNRLVGRSVVGNVLELDRDIDEWRTFLVDVFMVGKTK